MVYPRNLTLGFYEAAHNLANYLDNRGTPVELDFARLNKEVPRAREKRKIDINNAIIVAETFCLQEGKTIISPDFGYDYLEEASCLKK